LAEHDKLSYGKCKCGTAEKTDGFDEAVEAEKDTIQSGVRTMARRRSVHPLKPLLVKLGALGPGALRKSGMSNAWQRNGFRGATSSSTPILQRAI